MSLNHILQKNTENTTENSLDVVFHNELIILAGLHWLVKFVDLRAVKEVTSNLVAL